MTLPQALATLFLFAINPAQAASSVSATNPTRTFPRRVFATQLRRQHLLPSKAAQNNDATMNDRNPVGRRPVVLSGIPFGLAAAGAMGAAPTAPVDAAVEAQAGVDGPFYVQFEVALSDQRTEPVTIEIHPDWAPLGAAQFQKLVNDGFYDDCRFFRVVDGFVVQFGLNGDPEINKKYRKPIPDDKVRQSNVRGTVTFATSGPNRCDNWVLPSMVANTSNIMMDDDDSMIMQHPYLVVSAFSHKFCFYFRSRTTQMFINLGDNTFLDTRGFAPIGRVVGDGMRAIDAIYGGYGEGAPAGSGPDQMRIQRQGNVYLTKNFPKLSYVSKAAIVSGKNE
mmetsp:Transcript_26579/g.42725  ORF Transcript_26579/g.42725 Transcript_26579/m.42725 type:complete len:336 (-) Transcript_26579:136-1143(-)